MKRLFAAIVIAVSLIALPVGCSTPLRSAFTETQKAPKTVEQALKEWNAYIEANPRKVTIAQNNQVRDAFQKWKKYTLNVIDIGTQMSSTNNVASKPDLEVALHSQMSEASKASSDLINLINQFSK